MNESGLESHSNPDSFNNNDNNCDMKIEMCVLLLNDRMCADPDERTNSGSNQQQYHQQHHHSNDVPALGIDLEPDGAEGQPHSTTAATTTQQQHSNSYSYDKPVPGMDMEPDRAQQQQQQQHHHSYDEPVPGIDLEPGGAEQKQQQQHHHSNDEPVPGMLSLWVLFFFSLCAFCLISIVYCDLCSAVRGFV